MKIPSNTLPIPAAQFDAEFTAYLAQRRAHKFTVGVPAPFPAHECFRVMAEHIEAGGNVEIYDTGDPSPPVELDAVADKPLLKQYKKNGD